MSVQVCSIPGQMKGEVRSFWSGQAQIYLLNYLLHVGVMLIVIKVFIILFLLWKFLKQINKLSFQLNAPTYSLLGQTED